MLAPPPRNNIAGTPSNAVAKTAMGQLWDYVTERLGGAEGNFNYGGSLTGGAGVINIGSGQIYKDASGNVGIGTNSQEAKFSVLGSSGRFSELLGNSIRNRLASSEGGWGSEIGFANNAGTFLTGIFAGGTDQTATYLSFMRPGNVEAARIDLSSGNLLVGTTSSGFNARQVIDFAGSGTSAIGVTIHGATAGSGQVFLQLANNAASVVGSITQSGTTGVSFNTSSDYRLKFDPVPMTGALARNALLNPIFYRWKIDGSLGEGFFAHQLQEQFPNAVTGKKDATRTEQYVAGTRTVIKQRQVTDLQIEEREEIVLIDGKRVLRMVEYEVSVPLFEDVPVFNEDGSVATITIAAVRGADGQVITPETTAARTVQVPVMQEYEEEENVMAEREVPDYQGIGTGPLDGHFAACINDLQDIIATLTARITALEAAQ